MECSFRLLLCQKWFHFQWDLQTSKSVELLFFALIFIISSLVLVSLPLVNLTESVI